MRPLPLHGPLLPRADRAATIRIFRRLPSLFSLANCLHFQPLLVTSAADHRSGRLQSRPGLYVKGVGFGDVDMEAAESLFRCLEQVADPRKARGVRHPFQAIPRLTLPGLVCGQTTMAHIALFARLRWPVLKESPVFARGHPPRAASISRILAGVSYEELQGALSGWAARVAADQEMQAPVDGKRARQSGDAPDNPLVMVNVPAHRPEAVPGPVTGAGETVRTRGAAGPTGPVVLKLSMPEAADHERPVCRAGTVPGHSGPRTGLPGAGQGEPARSAGGIGRGGRRGTGGD